MSDQLPPLNPFLARSTYAMILTAVTALASAFNIDILARLGTTEGGILAAVDALLPLAGAVWVWLERKNPQYRIGR